MRNDPQFSRKCLSFPEKKLRTNEFLCDAINNGSVIVTLHCCWNKDNHLIMQQDYAVQKLSK